MQLPELNFKATFDLQIKRDKDKFFIYDLVRKTWLLLTPEEWVRQHWVHYFHLKKGRNLSSLILEKKLELNGTTKRIDLLVTEKTFEQTARYNSILEAEEIILSNGLQHIFAKFREKGYEFSPFEF